MHRIDVTGFILGALGTATLPLLLELGAPPLWCVAAVAVLLMPLAARGVVALIHGWRHGFRRGDAFAPLCRRCGYDLRASPRRCPECGHPVPPGHRVRKGTLWAAR